MQPPHNPLDNQRGAVLMVCLFLLLIMTMLGITALQTSTLQERMAANMGDMDQAFHRAEAALRWTEANIDADSLFLHLYTGDPEDAAALRRLEGKLEFREDCGLADATGGTPDITHIGLCYDEPPLQAAATWDAYKRASLEVVNRHIVVDLAGVTNDPHVTIEYTCQVVTGGVGECVFTYQILARGYGDDGTTQVTLEEIYRTE